ncbi:G patch domain-containing protein 11-like [Elysia marginata]|uniref:G patch domain-containing protein 11-like n=1 Tax=Elysia marginata TaxID=1093978 RepID=A0AAV4HLL6_9GAST|nr:G patch domain-containing protein 11-like [Elysia marginata]
MCPRRCKALHNVPTTYQGSPQCAHDVARLSTMCPRRSKALHKVPTTSDTRPGLAPKHIQQRVDKERQQKEADKKSRTVPRHKLEATQREAGLNASIAPSTKGFALLQKMGYKPGMGIGKEGTGIVEPVRIELKSGRSGLGRDSEMKRKATEMNQMRSIMVAKRKKIEEKLQASFRGRISERFTEKNVERDLRTAQKACLQLDQEKGLVEPETGFFWPASSLPSQKEEEEDEEEDHSQKQTLQQSDRLNDSDLEDEQDNENEVPADEDPYCDFSVRFL